MPNTLHTHTHTHTRTHIHSERSVFKLSCSLDTNTSVKLTCTYCQYLISQVESLFTELFGSAPSTPGRYFNITDTYLQVT